MDPKFTQGPWTISAVRTRESGHPVLQILGADEKVYAFVLYSDRTPELHRASYAAARLIAAAPDMYEALEYALKELTACKDLGMSLNRSIELATAALAKVQP